jgi:hypothetical protein
VWLSDVDGTKGYAVDFLSISLHAVSRDPEAYPSPCIYTQASFFVLIFKLDLEFFLSSNFDHNYGSEEVILCWIEFKFD